MHRCLFSYALPAEIRCFNASYLIRGSAVQSRRPLWRTYGAAAAALKEPDEQSQSWIESSLGLKYLDSTSPKQAPEDGADEDPLDFILEGYAAQPVKRKTRRERIEPHAVVGKISFSRRPVQGALSKAPRNSRVKRPDASPGVSDRRSTQQLRQKRSEYRYLRGQLFPRLPVSEAARPKHVRLWGRRRDSNGGWGNEYSTFWNKNFARVTARSNAMSASCVFTSAPLLDTRTVSWVESAHTTQQAGLPLDLEGIVKHSSRRGPPLERKRTVWSNVALWLLAYDQPSLLWFLEATCDDTDIPATQIADTLHLCITHIVNLPHAECIDQLDHTINMIWKFAQRVGNDHAILTESSIRHLLRLCNDQQMSTLYQALRSANFKLHGNTHLHFASALAQHDHFYQGLDALLQAANAGLRHGTASPQYRSVCSTLLRRAMALPGGMRVCLRIVDNLVKIGVTLDTRLCNVLILNAVEVGDLKTAYAIYHSLVEHGVKADEYTYALLLKGCKQNLDDSETLNQTIRNAIADTKLMTHKVLASEVLHCLALHHSHVFQRDFGGKRRSSASDEARKQAWSTICQAYAQLFDLAPIEQLGLPIPDSVRATPLANAPMVANPVAVSIMLQMYVQLTLTPNTLLDDIYANYKQLIASEDPLFQQFARQDTCPNAFLSAFIRSKSTLVNAAVVMKDMQSVTSKLQPTVQTWSIFLHGFTRHKQLRLAEQVLGFMRSEGIEPNQVTWSTLLIGYAGAQDVEGLLDVNRRMEARGLAWNEWTYRGSRRLRDVKAYGEVMRRKGETEVDFTQVLKEGLGKRIVDAEDDVVKVTRHYDPMAGQVADDLAGNEAVDK